MYPKIWRHFDYVLVMVAILLITYGVIMINSAAPMAESEGLMSNFVTRQIMHGLLGLALMVLVALIDYHLLENVARLIYVLALLSLGVVFILGRIYGGAQRWIDFGLFPFQPSEFSKVLLVVVLAKYLADREGEGQRFYHILISIIIVAVPMILIYLQPDLGTALALAIIWLGMMLMVGIRLRYLLLVGAAGISLLPLIWLNLEDYMRHRIMIFLDPGKDPLGAGYNTLQARIGIGAGGWFGQGYMNGTQSQLYFLRVRHTDFIFSVLAEELGFAGAIILFTLFALLLWRILRAASLARDTFGRLVTTGIACFLFFQILVNLAMNLGLLPVTGIPLPLVSYGGSSLITVLIGLGLTESVVMRHKRIEFV
ncbi:MAG: rod shape-determining protein RodA [Anaerolineae bacterium]